MTGVTLVIAARNAEATLGACLDAVAELLGTGQETTGQLAEIILVDDGSTDRTADIAGQRHVILPRLLQVEIRQSMAERVGRGQAALCVIAKDTLHRALQVISEPSRLGQITVEVPIPLPDLVSPSLKTVQTSAGTCKNPRKGLSRFPKRGRVVRGCVMLNRSAV